ncbi:MAG: MarR family winged helix-turn-helix transcriptional regulator [Desulfovibrio sp.]
MDRIDRLLAQWVQERPDLDASPMGILGRLMIINRHVESRFEKSLKPYGLNLAEFDALAVLRRCGAPFKQSIGVLCEHSLISSGAMTNRVDRLEKKNLVRRERNPEDRRGVIVALTDDGFHLVDSLIEKRLDEAQNCLGPISHEEVLQLENILKKMFSVVEEK